MSDLQFFGLGAKELLSLQQRHIHTALFLPQQRERVWGSKIQQDTAGFPQSPGMSDYQMTLSSLREVFSLGSRALRGHTLLQPEPASNAEKGSGTLRDAQHPRTPVTCFLTPVTSLFKPTTHTENDGLEGKGRIWDPILSPSIRKWRK